MCARCFLLEPVSEQQWRELPGLTVQRLRAVDDHVVGTGYGQRLTGLGAHYVPVPRHLRAAFAVLQGKRDRVERGDAVEGRQRDRSAVRRRDCGPATDARRYPESERPVA